MCVYVCGGGVGDIRGHLVHKLSFLIYLRERIIYSCSGILPVRNKDQVFLCDCFCLR